MTGSALERLAAVNPNTELWWDSSPLVFETWREQMLSAAAPEDRPALADELLRLWDPDRPAATLFRGVTTNPPLSLAALRDDPARWIAWLRTYRQSHPEADEEQAFWAVYKEVVRNGAAALMPLHEASGYRYGHISAQVDPRHAHDASQMLTEALDLASIACNVMIKVPGTSEGMTVLRELTARGIATNTTLAYTVSQFVAAAERVQAGLLTARAAGVDLTGWRSVITDMCARWENAPEFDASATEHGVELTPEDRRWGGIAIFKQALRVFRQRAYPSKMLLCSIRIGPEVDGVQRCWHLEHVAGAEAVFTLPPAFLTDFVHTGEHLTFRSRAAELAPEDRMAKLSAVPYFQSAHDPAGIPVEQFNNIPSLRSTAREFGAATEQMVAFVRESLPANGA
ncbi:MAG: transaldolase family protein [Solirubrobacteraceae bacterium]